MATILIVDDRPANRQFLVTLLSYVNHRILEAENGAQALEITHAEHPDLIITDILMPVMDGYEFARQLHEDLDLASTPVIFYTATYQAREARSLAKAAGVQYVLTKPAEPQAILDIVNIALGQIPASASTSEIFTKQLLDPLQVVSGKLTAKMGELGGLNLKLSELIALGIEIGAERNPQRLLDKFCESARMILNARYAAVGILTKDGHTLQHFITSGMDLETVARLGSHPTGKGILGVMLNEHQAIRLRDLTADPRSSGFPPGHPVMRSFLGVPITTSLQIYGNLYLTEKIGAEEFSEEDERLALTLSAQVAVAYENAYLYYDIQRHAASLQIEMTERRMAEEALREKERLLSEAQQIGHIGSWSLDINADALQYSDEMYHLLDISHEDFQHKTDGFLSLIYAADRPEATTWMQSIKAGRQTRELDFRVLRTNGELIYIQCRGAVMFDSVGKPDRFIGTAQDITERKLAEIQIRQQIARLTALRTIDLAITSSFNLHVTLDVVLSQTIEQLQVDAADILLLEPEQEILEYYAAKGFRTQTIKSTRIRMGEGHAGRAAMERRLVKIENLKEQPGGFLLTKLLAEENFACYYGVPLITKGKVKGVLEIFHRVPLQPYPEWIDFLETLAGQAAIAIDNATLFENLQESNIELAQAYDATIEGWSHALDLRDKETEGHTQRVTDMTLKLAELMGIKNEQLDQIRRGGLLHDIGKMGVPDGILLKPGKLTDDEQMVMRQHPQLAYEWLAPISFLRPALEIPYCHHEKWDGSGYPRGLKGGQIPLAARIFAVADVWDALTSHRPYREAWSREKTIDYIREQSGKYFDPQIVEVFTKYISSTIEK